MFDNNPNTLTFSRQTGAHKIRSLQRKNPFHFIGMYTAISFDRNTQIHGQVGTYIVEHVIFFAHGKITELCTCYYTEQLIHFPGK